MSHISTVRLTINDLDALADAAEGLGLRLERDKKTYATYGGLTRPCDATIVLPDSGSAYEVGLVRVRTNPDGSTTADPAGTAYEVRYDNWAGGKGMMERVGDGCGKLMQEYGIAKARRIAAARGMGFTTERLPDGSVRCFCTPPATKKWATAGAGRGW